MGVKTKHGFIAAHKPVMGWVQQWLMACVLLLGSVISHFSVADTQELVLPEYYFKASDNAAADVQAALQSALKRNKYALIVFGAQWCHDSRALSAQLSHPDMQAILKQNFVTEFVDVAYLNDQRSLIETLNYPTYFATPTLLIVDPRNQQTINIDTIDIWHNAASVDQQQYLDYFASFSFKQELANPAPLAPMASTNQQTIIKEYERSQAARLQTAYDLLGPMLQAYKEDRLGDPSLFNQLWLEVRTFRGELQKHVHTIRSLPATTALGDVQRVISEKTHAAQSWETK